jgi:transposase
MAGALSRPLREQIYERYEQGQSYGAMALELGRSRWTVRQLCRRYRDQGVSGVSPSYANCGQRGVRTQGRVRRAAIWLKRRHRSWGARLIRVILSQRWPERQIAHARTLQRWFQEAGVNSPRRARSTPVPQVRAKAVHEVWQLDGVEQVQLANGQQASWLTLADESSHALLEAVVFPPGSN